MVGVKYYRWHKMALNKLEIKVTNYKLRDLPKESDIQREIRYAMQSACMKVLYTARRKHRYEDLTGKLTKSFNWKLEKNGSGKIVRGVVYQDPQKAFYGRFQIEGTGIYIGRGKINLNKRGKFVGYWWRRKNIFMTNPWIRGIQGEDILGNAYKDRKEEIRQLFLDRLGRLYKG